jgi:hypothetical protein
MVSEWCFFPLQSVGLSDPKAREQKEKEKGRSPRKERVNGSRLRPVERVGEPTGVGKKLQKHRIAMGKFVDVRKYSRVATGQL